MRLTVVIPSRNRPGLAAQAVRSALDGLPGDAEVLVVDDRSTPPLAPSLGIADPRLRVIESQAAPGAAGARNWGVAQARGGRILFLDDDDLLLPGYADWVLAQGARYGFSAIAGFAGDAAPPLARFAAAEAQPVATLAPFRRRLAGLGCGFWIDRTAFLSLGGIAEDLRVNEDTEFSIRALSAGLPGAYSPRPGVLVRRHAMGHLTRALDPAQRAAIFGTILERHAAWLAGTPEARRHLRMRQVKQLAHAGDRPAAAQAIAQEPPADRLRLWLHYGLTRLADRLRGR